MNGSSVFERSNRGQGEFRRIRREVTPVVQQVPGEGAHAPGVDRDGGVGFFRARGGVGKYRQIRRAADRHPRGLDEGLFQPAVVVGPSPEQGMFTLLELSHSPRPKLTAPDLGSVAGDHSRPLPTMKNPCLAVVLSLFVGAALAQTVAPPVPSASSAADDTAIVLNPFIVSTEANKGYYASETLSGTQLRTNVRDLANPITVLTEDFMRDIGAVSYQDALEFLPSTREFKGDSSDPEGVNTRNGTPFMVPARNERKPLGPWKTRTRAARIASACDMRR